MQILEDFLKLESLDDDKLSSLIHHLNSNPLSTLGHNFLFEQWCNDNSIPIQDGKSILKFLGFVIAVISDKGNISEGLNQLKKLLFSSDSIPNQYVLAWKRLELTIPQLTNFLLNTKEKRLLNQAKKVGQLALTCDIRPVFDLERKNIQRYLFPIIATLRDIDTNELVTYELTEEELNDLYLEIKYALTKLQLLKNKFLID